MTNKVNQPLLAPTGVKVGVNSAPVLRTDPADTHNVGGLVTNVVSMTQAEYDALPSTDASTLYLING